MKVLYLVNLRLPTEKAYGIQIAKMCETFAKYNPNDTNEYPNAPNVENIEVELVAPYRRNNIKEDFFDYYSVKKNFKFKRIWAPDFYFPGKLDRIAVNIKNFISAVLLCFYVLTRKSDIIFTRDEWPLYLLSFFKRNLVFEVHRFSTKRKVFYKRFNKKGVKVVAISKAIKTDLVSSGYSSDKILVAHDGVDLEEFDIDISKEEARKKVGLPLNKRIIMYTGHLFEWKGAASLLQVARNFQFSRLRQGFGGQAIFNFQKNQEEVLFVFVGGTEYDVKKFREKTEELENVLILGHKPHKEIPFFLKAADVLVLPNSAKEEISSKYTSPLKLFEYMASGRPIVASALPSIMEILNNKNAVFVKPDDHNSLAEEIKKILDNNALGDEISRKSRSDVENYTWAKRARSIIDFLF